jgi:hypothetical protein
MTSVGLVIATRVRHGPAEIGEAFDITEGIGLFDRPHNLKVVGSNPTPATKFAR